MNRIFKDPALDKKYREDGFAVIPFADPRQLESLREVFSRHCRAQADTAQGFYYSLLANDFSGNVQIRNEIKKILQPSCEKNFENYQSVLESFLAKPATREPFLLHQDWSYCDEQEYSEATVWCPLEKITRDNGALFALKGSHLFFNTYRSGSLPTARIAAENGLEERLAALEADEGSAVIFHPALFHGSYPNQTSKLRVIASCILLEASAPMMHYQKKTECEAEAYEISDNIFFEEIPSLAFGNRLKKGVLIKSFPYRGMEISPGQLLEMCLEKDSASL